LQFPLVLAERFGHRVERLLELADLARPALLEPDPELPRGDLAGRTRGRADRARDAADEVGAEQQHEQRGDAECGEADLDRVARLAVRRGHAVRGSAVLDAEDAAE